MQPCLTHCILPEDSFSTSDGATDNQDRIDASEFTGFTTTFVVATQNHYLIYQSVVRVLNKHGSMNIFQNKKKQMKIQIFNPLVLSSTTFMIRDKNLLSSSSTSDEYSFS